MLPTLRVHRRVVLYQGLTCPHCEAPLEAATLGSGTTACARCRRSFEHERFTPAERAAAVTASAGASGETAACSRHSGNGAELSCTRCGVFMCGLCAMPIDGLLLCPACFGRLAQEEALESLRTHFIDYGARARNCAAAGFFFCMPLGWALGGLALYYGARAIRQSGDSLSGRAGLLLAMVLGLAELIVSAMVLTAGLWR
jgi:hypothetical protein